MKNTKQALFSVTAKDCRWDFYRGSGKGGQHKNKTDSACRCTHLASGAVGNSEEERSQIQNKRKAFERMAKTKTFQDWAKLEAKRQSGEMALIEAEVERSLYKTTVEIKKDGKWEKDESLAINNWDIINLRID